MRTNNRSRRIALLALSCLASAAQADLIANFDGFSEGQVFDTFTDGGIYFSDVYRHQTSYTNFAIEDASAGQLSGYSFPNALGFGGYIVGPGVAFGAFGGMTFTAGQATTAGLDIWTFPLDMGGNTLTLTGYFGAAVVDSISVTVPNSFSILHYRLDLPVDNYDSFKLTSNGPAVQGDSFIDVDNVTVAAVPEPTTLVALGLGLATLIRRRRSKAV